MKQNGKRSVNFDLDDSLYDLSGVPNWLERLRANDAQVYAEGDPCHDLQKLALYLNQIQKEGVDCNIISWLSKCKDVVLYRESRVEKRRFLQIQMGSVVWDEIHITAYGRKKHLIVPAKGNILIDDKDFIRKDWERHGGIAIDPVGITTDELIEKIASALLSLPS